MNLYPYQLENKNQITELWKIHNSVLYQLPTGGGKTVVINSIIEDILDKKILILVHRQEIIFQIRNRLKQRGIIAGVLIGNYEENLESDIIIGSILTVSRDSRLQLILDRDFDYMIIDEAHHACSDSYVKTITSFKNHNPNYKLLGVTATPYRKDGKKLNKIFDILIKGPTYSELREGEFLSDYTCYAAKLEGLDQVDLSGGDFKLSSLSKYMRADWLLEKAIKMYKDKGGDNQMLVFCVDKKHAIQTQKAYNSAGYNSTAIIDSDTPDDLRKSINKLYREGKIKIIISVQTLTEGVDLPETKVIQLLRPTLSIVLYLQILGRGTRIKEDGSKLTILDLSNNSYEHGLLDSNFDWNLNNTDPNPTKKINKIIGRKKNGGITIDEDEIEEEYLEIEEMSHSDFLLQNINGIEIAENENKEKDELTIKLYLGLIDTLNQKCKIPKLTFSDDISRILNYNNWEEIRVNYNNYELSNLKYDKGGIRLDLGWGNNLEYKDYYKAIIKGKLAEFIQKELIQKLIINVWKSIKDIQKSKINIQELKDKAEEIDKEKCIFKIDTLLSEGQYIFKLHTEEYSNTFSPRYGYGRFNTITFIDEPKRLKVNNNIQTDNNIFSNLNKDVLINTLYKKWYKQKEK